MNEPEHIGIGELLERGVPPLPEPADRIGEVRARVRRTRLRAGGATVAGVAAAVVVVLAVPPLLVGTTDAAPQPAGSAPTLDADSCPSAINLGDDPVMTDIPASPPPTVDQGGPLVPEGAVEAMLCQQEILYSRHDELRGDVVGSWVLTIEVARLIDALNELPTEEEVRASNPGVELGCLPIGYSTSLSLVLRYPDGGTTTVVSDSNCSRLTADNGQVRYGGVPTVFSELYRAQLIATTPDPDSIATPTCPETLSAGRLDQASAGFGPERWTVEHVLAWTPTERLALPMPLVAATTCRYAGDGDGAWLVDSREDRGDLAALRDAVNGTFREVEGSDDWVRPACGEDMGGAVPDVVLAADALGGVAEFWIYSTATGAPCPAAFPHTNGHEPTPELITYVE